MAHQPVVWQAGRVVAVETETQGSVVVGWTGNTLTLVNAADFPRDGGTFTVDGDPTVYTYTDVSEGLDELSPDVVTTLETAPAGFSAERVNIYPAALDTYAMVELINMADAVHATVTHALKAFLPDGVREPDQAEWVNIELRGTEWFVAEVIGRKPSIASVTVDGLDDALGQLGTALEQAQTDLTQAQADLGTLNTGLTQAQTDIGTLNTGLAQAQSDADDAMAKATDAWDDAQTATGLANDAQNTADAAVTGTTTEYASGASETVAPATGWSTTAPARTPGTFIWMRTTVTYGSGSSTTTSPVMVTGNTGAPGGDGTPAPVVTLTATSQVLTVPAAGGATTPATSTVTATATNTLSAWAYSVDGGSWNGTPPAGVTRSGSVVTVTGATFTGRTLAIRATDSAGVADTLTVAKVADGAAGNAGADAYTLLLTNEAHTFPGSTTAALAGSTTSTVMAYKGATAIAATVGSITGAPTGMSTSVASNNTTAPVITVTVTTSLTARNGTLDVPVTADGKTFTKTFSWAVSRTGAAGSPGGAGVSVTSVTPYFRQQTKGTAAPAAPTTNPPSGWVTTEPGYAFNTDLYRTDQVIYSSGAFSYSAVSKVSSYEASTSAMASANGRNSIIWSTGTASGTTHPSTGLPLVEGDLWRQTNVSGNVIQEWKWSGSSWVATAVSGDMVTNMDVHKLTVSGSLGVVLAVAQRLVADFAAFKLLTADKVIVGGSDNLIPNGDLNRGYVEPWASVLSYDTTDKPSETRGALKTVAGQGSVATVNGADSWFDVTPNTEYLFEVWLKADTAGSRFYLELRDQAGAHAGTASTTPPVAGTTGTGGGSYLVNARTLSTSWTKYSCVYTTSATATRARLGTAQFNHSTGTNTGAVVSMAGARIRSRSGAVTISDGAITGDKLYVDQALANKITATMATFQSVFANAITANMLNVDNALAQKLQATMATFQTVFADTLTANMIQADSFAGYNIAGANIYSPGSTATPRTQIVGPTLSVVRSDTEGREFPTVQLGGSTADQVMLYDASGNPVAGFNSDGRGLASELMVGGDMTVGGITNVEQLLVDGTDVMEYITPLPRGVVARQKLGSSAAGNTVQFGNTWLGYYELFFDSYASRVIRVRYNGLVYCSQPGQYNFELRATSTPGYASIPSSPRPVATTTGTQVAIGRVMATSAGAFYPIQLEAWFQPYGGRYRVLLSAQCQSSGMYGYLASHDNWPSMFVAEDMGSYVSFGDGGYNRGGGTPYSGTATETAPTTPKQTYTTTWDSTWNRSWRAGAIVTDGMLHQGYYGGSQRTSQVGFSSAVQTALSGAAVSKLELYMENLSWYYGSGGKLRIGAHGNGSAGSEKTNSSPGPIDSATWVAGGKGWVTLPSSWYASFASGAYKGVTLGEGAGTDMNYYGKFSTALAAAKLRATYTK